MSEEEIKALNKRIRYLERELRYSIEARERLEDLNDRNQRIRNKSNEELNEKNEELALVIENLKRAQMQLVHQEKMASLGQLVASIAHELNTPLGAIRSSASSLRGLLFESIIDLPAKYALLEPAIQSKWSELIQLALKENKITPTSREERQARRLLQTRLEENGIEAAEKLSRILVEMGILNEIDSFLNLLKENSGYEAIRLAHNVVSVHRSSENILLAAERAAKIVFALKTFVHPGNVEGELTKSSIADNLDIVLTLYRGQIKNGIELVRDFQNKGFVYGRHDQLNQVWTNLLHNALQSMESGGELKVSVYEKDTNSIQVDIMDSGPGISEAIQNRIFDPFFTTKRVGEGSGLGLSICQDIVSQHNGSIFFQSQPGKTIFSVLLPIEQKENTIVS